MLLVSSKEEIYNYIIHILNCMSIVFIILIIYFIVYILDHVDHEDLPRDGFWCTVYHSTTKKSNNNLLKQCLLVDFAVINV